MHRLRFERARLRALGATAKPRLLRNERLALPVVDVPKFHGSPREKNMREQFYRPSSAKSPNGVLVGSEIDDARLRIFARTLDLIPEQILTKLTTLGYRIALNRKAIPAAKSADECGTQSVATVVEDYDGGNFARIF